MIIGFENSTGTCFVYITVVLALTMALSEEVRLYTGTESVSRRVARGQLAVLHCLSQLSVAA